MNRRVPDVVVHIETVALHGVSRPDIDAWAAGLASALPGVLGSTPTATDRSRSASSTTEVMTRTTAAIAAAIRRAIADLKGKD